MLKNYSKVTIICTKMAKIIKTWDNYINPKCYGSKYSLITQNKAQLYNEDKGLQLKETFG